MIDAKLPCTLPSMCGMALAWRSAGVPRLIIDTDMSTDCDDVGATCIAHAMMDRGEVELIAVVHNTGV